MGLFKKLPQNKGPRILSLDGGGTRGLVSLMMLIQIEKMMKRPIHELFDMVVGTSTGGIIAVLIGVKKYPIEKIKEIYLNLCTRSFKTHSEDDKQEPDIKSPRGAGLFSSVINLSTFLKTGSWYRTSTFENLIRSTIHEQTMIGANLETEAKVCLVSAKMNQQPVQPYLFRTYNTPPTTKPLNEGECFTEIWQAVRSTTSAPGYFDPLEKDGSIYRDGGMIANNPAGVAVCESKMLWPESNVHILLSLGTGKPPSTFVEDPNSWKHLGNQIVNSCTDTEQIHNILSILLPSPTYFRIQPEDPSVSIGMDEVAPDKLTKLLKFIDEWIVQNQSLFKKICARLEEWFL
uniref:PNPLA domain-containing protein n=1 Tax=Arcella intermedia TaxID=1963864 RepID=A0A6B2L8C4_9EUKA